MVGCWAWGEAGRGSTAPGHPAGSLNRCWEMGPGRGRPCLGACSHGSWSCPWSLHVPFSGKQDLLAVATEISVLWNLRLIFTFHSTAGMKV